MRRIVTGPAILGTGCISAATDSRAIAPERLDELARAVLDGARPVRFTIAASREHREWCFRIRYEHVIASRWTTSDCLDGGLEIDRYDAGATALIARDGPRIAGTCRIVWPRPGARLPVEDAFDLPPGAADRAVEWGRLLVCEEWRGGDARHNIMMGLFARAWLETRRAGYRAIASVASPGMIRLYRSMGFDVAVLGAARDYWGERRFPIRFTTA